MIDCMSDIEKEKIEYVAGVMLGIILDNESNGIYYKVNTDAGVLTLRIDLERSNL